MTTRSVHPQRRHDAGGYSEPDRGSLVVAAVLVAFDAPVIASIAGIGVFIAVLVQDIID